MAIVRRHAKLLGARFWLESVDGGSPVAQLTLPRRLSAVRWRYTVNSAWR